MKDALVGIDALREVDMRDRSVARANKPLTDVRNDLVRLIEQLLSLCGITHGVCALTQEAEARWTDVKPCPHAVATFGRRRDRNRIQSRKAGDPPQRVADDLCLQLSLPFVRNVAICLSSARRIAFHRPAIRIWVKNVDHGGKDDIAALAVNPSAYPLSRYRTANQHNPAFVAREHQSASDRAFDR